MGSRLYRFNHIGHCALRHSRGLACSLLPVQPATINTILNASLWLQLISVIHAVFLGSAPLPSIKTQQHQQNNK